MRLSDLFLALALYLVAPIISSPLTPRAQVCMNDQNTIAGTVFQPRDLPDTPSLHIRERIPIPCVWCQIGGATYIIVTQCLQYQPPYTAVAQTDLLQETLDALERLLIMEGDHILTGGNYEYLRDGMIVEAYNVNNHQLTLGVLRSSLSALRSFITAYQVVGTIVLNIYDGANWVGWGSIRYA